MTQKQKIEALEKEVEQLKSELKITKEFYELWRRLKLKLFALPFGLGI
jgi:hypothetical protein